MVNFMRKVYDLDPGLRRDDGLDEQLTLLKRYEK